MGVWDEEGGTVTMLGITTTDTPTDGIVYGSTLFIAEGNQYSYYTAGGTALTTVSDPAKFFTIFDSKLLKIDNNGLIKSSLTGAGGSWVGGTVQVPVPAGYVTGFCTWRLADDNPAPYVGTRQGLWAVDMTNGVAHLTDLQTSISTNSGRGMTPYSDGNLYFPQGLLVHRYGNRVISTIGPNEDDGLPRDYRGRFTKFLPAHKWLIGLLDNTLTTTVSEETSWHFNVFDGFESSCINRQIMSLSAVLAFSGSGWHTLYTSQQENTTTETGCVTSAYDEIRLWFGAEKKLKYMRLPEDILNPLNDIDYEFAPTSEHITGWFDA
jgi:hypothetical protein